MTTPRGRNGIATPAASNGRVYFDRQVEFNRFPSQRRFDDLHVRYKGFSGPIGSGKSKALCMEAIRMAYVNSGTIGLVGAPTYRLLTDSTLVELLGTLEETQIPFTFHRSSYRIHLHEPNSMILLRTLDEPERLRAMNLAWFGIDELTYCKEASWLRLDEKFYRQEVLGEYLDMDSGAVYHGFGDGNIRAGMFNPKLPLIVALDFNVNPMAGVLLQCDSFYGRKEVQVLKEIVLPGSHTAAWLEVFIARTEAWAKALGHPLEVLWYGDAAGDAKQANSGGETNWTMVVKFMGRQEDYRSRFLYARKNPSVIDRVNAVNALLYSFGDGHRLAGERRLFLDPDCRELLTDFEDVKWKVDAAGNTYHEVGKNTDHKRTHLSDALGYYVETEFGLRIQGKFLPNAGI